MVNVAEVFRPSSQDFEEHDHPPIMANANAKLVNSLYLNGKFISSPISDWFPSDDPPEDLVKVYSELEAVAREIEDGCKSPIETVAHLERWFGRISDVLVSARGVILRGTEQQD